MRRENSKGEGKGGKEGMYKDRKKGIKGKRRNVKGEEGRGK